MTGVLRQAGIVRNLASMLYNNDYAFPYADEEIVGLFLQVPLSIRRRKSFGKIILRKLAQKRGVPQKVIDRPKKGMSYGYKDYINHKRHIPIWKEIKDNSTLNKYIDTRLVFAKKRDDFFVFDTLRSLHYYLKYHV